jgi:hypothetical protein
MTLTYAWFGIPYFLYDAFAMFYVARMGESPKTTLANSGHIVIHFFKWIFTNPVIVIHHLVLAPLGFSLIVVSQFYN